MKDRFDLEQEILKCWHVTDDIETVANTILDGPQDLSDDELWNILYGLKAMYDLKFETLFDTMTQVLRLDQYRPNVPSQDEHRDVQKKDRDQDQKRWDMWFQDKYEQHSEEYW